MARFERSKDRKSSPRVERNFEDNVDFEDRPKRNKSSGRSRDSSRSRDSGRGGFSRGGRDSGRSFNRGGRDSGRGFSRDRPRRELEMTKVTCSACGEECEVPFKPTSDKPVYCKDCFSKTEGRAGKPAQSNTSSHDLDVINEKLNKIMKALDIE